MKKGIDLGYEIYLQLKVKYSNYQFDDFLSLIELNHCAIIFQKEQNGETLKFMIEISTSPFKIFRREIDLYIGGKRIHSEVKNHKEYEDILYDARKIAKGKFIE